MRAFRNIYDFFAGKIVKLGRIVRENYFASIECTF